MGPTQILLLLTLVALIVGAVHAPARLGACLVGVALVAIVLALALMR